MVQYMKNMKGSYFFSKYMVAQKKGYNFLFRSHINLMSGNTE